MPATHGSPPRVVVPSMITRVQASKKAVPRMNSENHPRVPRMGMRPIPHRVFGIPRNAESVRGECAKKVSRFSGSHHHHRSCFSHFFGFQSSDPFHAGFCNPEAIPTFYQLWVIYDRKVIAPFRFPERFVPEDVPKDLNPNGSWIVGATAYKPLYL